MVWWLGSRSVGSRCTRETCACRSQAGRSHADVGQRRQRRSGPSVRARVLVTILLFVCALGSVVREGIAADPPAVADIDRSNGIIPLDRVTVWNPGLRSVGGIPERNQIHASLSPRGLGLDDTPILQRALDTCPPGKVVQLSVGTFNINGPGLLFRATECTLRGAGTGELGNGRGGTRLVKADRERNVLAAVLYVGNNPRNYAYSVPLLEDAVKGSFSVTLPSPPRLAVGALVLIDQDTESDPRVWWGPEHGPSGSGSRRWFARQGRSLSQVLEVKSIQGRTVTFTTPIHITFKTAHQAEFSLFAERVMHRVGIENLYVYGGMGGHGNISVSLCAYCWIRNVESHWSVGPSITMASTFRSELRDSYIHETPDPNPGGAGYLLSIERGASDNLVENNVLWYGNKNMVMRATGGGNVVAYNYLDDAFGGTYPDLPEVGLNAAHYTTPHMELLEGNYSHNYGGETYWGNSIYITVFRNHLSGIRAARPPLDTYEHDNRPYRDFGRRTAVEIHAHSNFTNLVGNVLGFNGQTLLSHKPRRSWTFGGKGGYSNEQTAWNYERLTGFPPTGEVNMWIIGPQQAGGWKWVANTHETQLREGNWDWVTRSQRWHGIGGTAGSSKPKQIPNSLYLTQKPDFFGNQPWPWVNPVTGEVTVLPAKACLEAGKMPTCMKNAR